MDSLKISVNVGPRTGRNPVHQAAPEPESASLSESASASASGHEAGAAHGSAPGHDSGPGPDAESGSGPEPELEHDPNQPQAGSEPQQSPDQESAPTPECTVITVAGEIDIAAKEQFFSVLSENLAPGEALVLDLAEVTFLDSGGLWALLKAAKHATATGAEMLVVASPAVSRTLALTQTSHFLALHHDRASAVQAGAVHDRPQQDE